MDSPENSSFKEMNRPLAMGWDPHVFQSTPIARAEKTHGAWGADRFGSAKGFGGLSLGANTEGGPSKRASDHEFSDAVHTGH